MERKMFFVDVVMPTDVSGGAVYAECFICGKWL